ncbi:MAG: phage tail sheath subtilisin-like domain-containing protein [Burkholderia gladioli]
MINVLDPVKHNSAAAAEVVTLDAAGRATLSHPGVVASLPIAVKDSKGVTTYKPQTDYVLDPVSGKLSRVTTGAIAPLSTLSVDYSFADPSKVTAADVIGGVDDAARRTGMQQLQDGYSAVGYYAKILIAPVFSTQASVSAALTALAAKIRAITFFDAPSGLTPQQVIQARGAGGNLNLYTSSERAVPCYPYVKIYDKATDSNVLAPLSARAAGIQSRRDQENGYWYSPSNTEILGIVGLERPIYAMINDPNSETNQLNAAGITTVFASFGTGYRLWGNRSAAYPSETGPKQFINIRRTADIIEESLEYFSLQYIDGPLSNALIDAVVESGNGFIRKLKGDGAVLDGRVWYDKGRNPKEELAAGHLTLSYDFMPPPPAERITFTSSVNIDYLANLGAKS